MPSSDSWGNQPSYTFSAAEMRWPEVIEAIKAQQGKQVDFSQLDWNTKCEILRSNPVTVRRLFEKRVNALMTHLILSPAQPIGEVEDYFYRVEFQARGSPHIHIFGSKTPPNLENTLKIMFMNLLIATSHAKCLT